MSGTPESCHAYEEDLSGLLDRELAPEREAQVRAHLAECAACRARLAAFGALDAQLRELAPRPVPHELEARLRARLADEARGPSRAAPSERDRPRRRRAPIVLAALVAAAAALAVYLGVVRGPGSLTPERPVARGEAPRPPEPDLETASDEDLAVAIELDTLEDLDVIANLELLEALDAGGEKDQG